MDTRGKRDGMNWEIGMDICIQQLCIKQTANENLLYSTRKSTQSFMVTKWEGDPKKREYMYS